MEMASVENLPSGEDANIPIDETYLCKPREEQDWKVLYDSCLLNPSMPLLFLPTRTPSPSPSNLSVLNSDDTLTIVSGPRSSPLGLNRQSHKQTRQSQQIRQCPSRQQYHPPPQQHRLPKQLHQLHYCQNPPPHSPQPNNHQITTWHGGKDWHERLESARQQLGLASLPTPFPSQSTTQSIINGKRGRGRPRKYSIEAANQRPHTSAPFSTGFAPFGLPNTPIFPAEPIQSVPSSIPTTYPYPTMHINSPSSTNKLAYSPELGLNHPSSLLSTFSINRPRHYLHSESVNTTWNRSLHLYTDAMIVDTEQGLAEALLSTVEYDMDEQDFAWLHRVNQETSFGNWQISENDFELIMDQLEKYWYSLTKPIQRHSARKDEATFPDDLPCAICADDETSPTNLIVICDGCDVAVHQECYGVVHIPEGPWLCRRCYLAGQPSHPSTIVSPVRTPATSGTGYTAKCVLCPWPGGALKQTTETNPKRGWAHLLCARFLPHEVSILNPSYQEPIDISRVDRDRWGLLCGLCRLRRGAPVQCQIKSCHTAFHPLCARLVGAKLDVRTGEAFCLKHSKPQILTENIQSTHVNGIDDSNLIVDVESLDEAGKTITNRRLSTLNLQKRPTLSDHSQVIIPSPKGQKCAKPPHVIVPTVEQARTRKSSKPLILLKPVAPRIIIDQICALPNLKIPPRHRHSIVTAIARYWSLRRAHRRGVPLLRRLQLEPWTSGPKNPNYPREWETRVYLCNDLASISELTRMVWQKERKKLASLHINLELFRLLTSPFEAILCVIVNELYDFDAIHDRIFKEPVSKQLAPDYYDIIQTPVCIDQIAKQIPTYTTFQSFTHHVQLLWQNAMSYNAVNTIYYRTAERLRDHISPILAAAAKSLSQNKIAGPNHILWDQLVQLLPEEQILAIQREQVAFQKQVSQLDYTAKNQKRPISSRRHISINTKPITTNTEKAISPDQLKHDMVVWAKLAPFPYYPARIVDLERVGKAERKGIPTTLLKPKTPTNRVLVQFFDTRGNWNWIETDKLMQLGESFEKDLLALIGAKSATLRRFGSGRGRTSKDALRLSFSQAIAYRNRNDTGKEQSSRHSASRYALVSRPKKPRYH